MPASILKTMHQLLDINDIKDIVVTAIQLDTDTGEYYREIRFLGTADEGINNGAAVGTTPEVLAVRVRSEVSTDIKVTFPEGEF